MPYYHLHPDQGMNFQINRILTYGEEAGRLDEIKAIAPQITDFESWYVQWDALAKRAEAERRYLHAAYYFRMAEFFLTEERVEKLESYHAFRRNFYRAIGEDTIERCDVAYEGAALPTIRLQAENEKRVVVVHGGYDSFTEEFYLTVRTLPQLGYTVILFEGPGQGEARKRGLTFTHEWEKPTTAIFDHFRLHQAALLGISWGGYLALRAAAFEPRISHVIAYDVCFDGLEVMTRPMPIPLRQFVRLLVRINDQGLGNALINRLRKKSLLLDWVIAHGMYITGTRTPIDFYRHLSYHTAREISRLIKQNVLLLAGERDHYIPLNHFYRQRKALVNAHSVSSRLFTVSEGGEQHCQVGNHQLAVDEMTQWLDSCQRTERREPSREVFGQKTPSRAKK